jgi:hypothetical protein
MADGVEAAPSADAPWMRRKDWASGWIRSRGVAQLVLWWVVAGLWNGFMLILIHFFRGSPGEEDVVKVLLLFELIGLGILVWVVRRTLGWLRYGGSVLELASTPGVIGGMLEGRIHTGIKTFPAKPIRIVLTCLRRRSVKRGVRGHKEIDTSTDILWQADRSVAVEAFTRGLRGLTIPLRIGIPFGLPGSDSSDPDNQIHWQLVVTGDLPGVDFRAEFPVPAFVTATSRSDWTREKVDEMADRERSQEVPPGSIPDESRETPSGTRPTRYGGTEYLFRAGIPRKKATLLTLAAVLVCAGSFGLYLWLGELGPFAVLPGIAGLLLLIASVGAWTFKSRVLIENGSVRVRKSVLGIPRIREIHFSEVDQVRVRHEEVDGVREQDRSWDIEIERKEGQPVGLGASIRERSEAVRLANEIRQLVRTGMESDRAGKPDAE